MTRYKLINSCYFAALMNGMKYVPNRSDTLRICKVHISSVATPGGSPQKQNNPPPPHQISWQMEESMSLPDSLSGIFIQLPSTLCILFISLIAMMVHRWSIIISCCPWSVLSLEDCKPTAMVYRTPIATWTHTQQRVASAPLQILRPIWRQILAILSYTFCIHWKKNKLTRY